jgi:hypothetical protein
MIIFDLVSGSIRVLSRDQKYVHFDSLIFPRCSVFKNFILRMSCIYWFTTRHLHQLKDFSFFINFFIGLALLFADHHTSYYNAKFKKFMVMLDLCLIFAVVFPLVFRCLGHTLTLTGHIILVAVNLCTATAYSLVYQENF